MRGLSLGWFVSFCCIVLGFVGTTSAQSWSLYGNDALSTVPRLAPPTMVASSTASASSLASGVATFTQTAGTSNSGLATINNDLTGSQLGASYFEGSPKSLANTQPFASQDLLAKASGGWHYPKGRVTFEGFLFSKPGVGDHPLILDDINPIGEPLVTSKDLSIDGEVGTQVFVEQQSFYLSYMTTGNNNTTLESQSDPADINWFGARDADPSNRYFTVYNSVLRMGDIGVRRQTDPGTDVYLGLAMGRLSERMDLLTSFDPKHGFYSYARNEFYGAHLGVRRQFFNNGNYRIEGMARGGLYFNSMEVNGVAEDFDGYWNDDSIAYSGMGNISVVIPAWPVNFRVGYQLMLVGGVVTPQDASRTLNSFDLSAGEIETGEVFYHGLTFGIEKLW